MVYPKPGDLLPLFQPALFQIEDKRQFAIENTLFPNPYQLTPFAWWNDSRGFTFDYNQRGHQLYRVVEVDAASGNARTLIEESSATFVNYEPLSRDQFDHGKSFRQDIADAKRSYGPRSAMAGSSSTSTTDTRRVEAADYQGRLGGAGGRSGRRGQTRDLF